MPEDYAKNAGEDATPIEAKLTTDGLGCLLYPRKRTQSAMTLDVCL